MLIGLTFWGVSLIAAFGSGILYAMKLRHHEQSFQAEERKKKRDFDTITEASRRAHADRMARTQIRSGGTTGPTQTMQTPQGQDDDLDEADLVEIAEERTPLRPRQSP